MMSSGVRVFLILALLGVCHPSLEAQFTDLGPGNAITGLSGDGGVGVGTNFSEYFLYTSAGGIQGIGGTIPGLGIGGQAQISRDGTKISGSTLNPASNQYELSRYDTVTGAWTPLGGIGAICPGGPGDETSSGWGISRNGHSVVGLGWAGFCGPAHAIQWTESGIPAPPVDLGSSVAGSSSRANGTNEDGSVVVGWQDDATGFRQGAVWHQGVQTIITNGIGEPVGEAAAVDPTGTWVVGDGSFGSLDQAWRWSAATGVEPLGILNPAGFFPRGSATAISDDGSVIVGFERELGGFPTSGIGFIWTAATGMVNLNDYLDSLGIQRNGFNASLPLSISGDGRTIGGAGIAAGSLFGGEGFLVTIPEPTGGILAMVAVFGGLSARRRKNR